MSPSIHEEQIACVRLPADVRPTSSADHPSFLLAVLRSGQPPAVLGDGLPFYPAFHAIRLVCSTLATLTVDGQLRVNRRSITPEAYLRRWHKALAQPLTVQEFARQWRVRPTAVIQWPYVPAMAGTRAGWRNPPFETFGELLLQRSSDIDRVGPQVPAQDRRPSLAQRGQRGSVADDTPQLTRLRIDLTSDNGARDAWWADDFVSRALPRSQASTGQSACTRLELRPLQTLQTSGDMPRQPQTGVPA